ncbi:MAG: hypothetical protein ACJARX_001237 [Psychroserpens sp.]|jgi:hypothetical protein|uniref:thioredoxin family protein n=1 Tax=Psychroserpens sp. TaxID=2020870 RepID=UPI0039E6C229
MKKLLFILTLAFTLQLSAQDNFNWLTDYKVALEQSKAQDKVILAYVTDNHKTEASAVLKTTFFSSEDFKTMSSKVILLNLDISDKNSYNARLGIHYMNNPSVIGLALINEYNDKIGDPLTDITADNIASFIIFLNSKL